jgi:hypothetical protein
MTVFEELEALKKAINEINFPEKEGKTLMDRFSEVSDNESLNQLHEEWKKFWRKRSLELHPDKSSQGSDEEDVVGKFQTFQSNREKIDEFFDKYTKTSEVDGSKRKFIDDNNKASFSTIINFLSNNRSQNPNQGQSQSSFQGEKNQGSTSQSKTTSQSNRQEQTSRNNGDSFGAKTGANYFSSFDAKNAGDDLTDLDKILRAFIEQISRQDSSSSRFSDQNGSNFEKNSKQSAYSFSERDLSSKNDESNQDKINSSQNRSNSFRGESSSNDPTLVFCFSSQGFGIIFKVQERERTAEKKNQDDGRSKFVDRFSNGNGNNLSGLYRR